MSFDWMSFATGFLERTGEIQEQRRVEAKEFEDEQRAAALRNAQLISRRRAIADQVTGYASYLKRNGVSDEQIQAAISTGPKAIEALTTRVQKAVQSNGNRPLASSDVSALIDMPEGFTPLDMTTQEFIDQTYGLSVKPITKEERQFSLLDRLGGKDQMARAQERLNRTPYAEGMTIEQINQAAMQGDYESLIPGTFVSITGAGTGYDIDASTDFTTTFERRLSSLQNSNRWKETLGIRSEEQRAAAQARLLEEAMSPIVRMGMQEYGNAFIADQESYLRSIMGDAYMDKLIRKEVGVETDEEEPAAEPMATTTEEEATDIPLEPITVEPDGEEEPSATVEEPEVEPEVEQEEKTTYEILSEQGVDDTSIALLESHGSDMLSYMREKGATSDEDISMALSEWGQENGMTMPFDKSALIYALKLVMQ